MPVLSLKYSFSVVVSVLLSLGVLVPAAQASRVGIALRWIFLLFCLAAAGYTVAQKHRALHRQGSVPRSLSIRNLCIEIAAMLLAMALAGLAGRMLSDLFTGGMAGTPQRMLAGLGIGLLAGWAVGLLVRGAAGRLIKSSTG